MKRLVMLVLALCILIPCTACGQKTPTWQEQYDIGVKYLSDGNYEEAIIAFTAAIEIDPKRAEAYVGRGNAYISSGETEENLSAALADYENAVEMDETNAEAYLGMADVYIRQGDFDKALEILQEALEKTKGDSSVKDKIDEIKRGKIVDSSNNIRRSNNYDNEGRLVSYTLYEYDEQSRRCGWANWTYTNRGDVTTLLDSPYLENYAEVVFNSGNLPEQNRFYDADGTFLDYDTFVYNDLGLKVEQHRYQADGTEKCYFLYYYNKQNQEIRYEGYHADGSMYAYWISEYDENGNFVKETQYHLDGTFWGYSTNG